MLLVCSSDGWSRGLGPGVLMQYTMFIVNIFGTIYIQAASAQSCACNAQFPSAIDHTWVRTVFVAKSAYC